MTTDISVGMRWDPLTQQQEPVDDYEFDYDGGNSSSRLFERSRIKALAGQFNEMMLPALASYNNKSSEAPNTFTAPSFKYDLLGDPILS